ncbi:hypothetical protein [uncultured Pseudoteredinibacter sp.]|uniref:CBU_0592 family membrane protein n=1 Tax=uncultured Pseudoteredinibacter sp. TaxID=1641701 RepID=UPI002626FE3C|nr:hypothetical protein [uncultured Pseudoteredinibacter sp.]
MIALIGWFGTVLYLANHAYLSISKAHSKPLYFGANALAAACLVFSSLALSSWQAVFNNFFWFVISALLLLQVDLKRLPVSPKVFYVLFSLLLIYLLVYLLRLQELNASILSWSSVLCFGMAYLLMSSQKISVLQYLYWNIYAAIAFLPQLWLDQNIAVFALELCWAAISIFGVCRRHLAPDVR